LQFIQQNAKTVQPEVVGVQQELLWIIRRYVEFIILDGAKVGHEQINRFPALKSIENRLIGLVKSLRFVAYVKRRGSVRVFYDIASFIDLLWVEPAVPCENQFADNAVLLLELKG